MRCLEKPVLRARTGCEISALHGNWSAVQPGFEGCCLTASSALKMRVDGQSKRGGLAFFFGAILQTDLFERPAVPKIFVDMY